MDDLRLVAPILIPLATAFFVPVVRRMSHPVRAAICIVAMVGTVAVLMSLVEPVFGGETLVYWMGGWRPREGLAVGISLSVDAWGLLMALVAAVVGLLSLIYSTVYMREESGRGPYYVLTMLLIAGLIGFALSGDLFNQFVWLEVFSVAAFALTAFHIDDRRAMEAAFKYLMTNSVAAFFLVIGLILLYMQTGALNLAEIASRFEATPAGLVAIGLLVGGYATKAALVPWHFWLPDAHAVAPSPTSALFSGAMIKMGVYAIGRIIYTLVPLPPGGVLQAALLLIAAATMVLGGLQMVQQGSIKRILAFSSVAQMGYVLMGLALGTPLGAAAAALHVVHHALVKSALFMGAGMVFRRSGVEDLQEGGGLARPMPFTFVTMALAGLGLSGMPFLSGFVSKTMLVEAALATSYGWLAWVAMLSGLLTFAGVARLIWHVFLAAPAASRRGVREAPPFGVLPGLALVALSLLVGFFPQRAMERLAWPAAVALDRRDEYIAQVMEPVARDGRPVEAIEMEAAPKPLEWRQWWRPAVVLIGGGLLAYWLARPADGRPDGGWLRPVRVVAYYGRLWHSGLVGDYVLWNSFGTALMALAVALAGRFGWL
jgi:multicomponent Na+:H+ antiporter subunit D